MKDSKDSVYLKHILDTICDIEQFTQGLSKEDFLSNRGKQYAVLHGLEIIGEATKNLSRDLKKSCPEVNWKDVAGMRDKLIHVYFGVKLPLVWKTVKEDLPTLKKHMPGPANTF
jgi:uncharacterized protein with HEPN domain